MRLRLVMLGAFLVFAFLLPALAGNTWGRELTESTESLTGTIIVIDLTPPATSLNPQIGDEILVVELGPRWFVENFPLKVGDEITLVGERTSENTMVAYSLNESQNGNTVTLTLRDANGKPVWSGASGPKSGNQHRDRNRITLENRGNGNGNGNGSNGNGDGNGNTSDQGHQSGSQDGSGNQ